MGRPERGRLPLAPRGTYGRHSVDQANCERDTGVCFSIVPLLFLYCSSIVSLLFLYCSSSPGRAFQFNPLRFRPPDPRAWGCADLADTGIKRHRATKRV
jgi:hypothetical protein